MNRHSPDHPWALAPKKPPCELPKMHAAVRGGRRRKIDSDICGVAGCGEPRYGAAGRRSRWCGKHREIAKRKCVKDGSVDRFRSVAP